MTKLLKADFSRLFKNKAFYLLGAVLMFWSCDIAVTSYSNFKNISGLDDFSVYPLETMPFVLFFIAICTTFFIGTNFSSNTVRNKLCCGYSKAQIYLSNAVVSLFVSAVYSSIFIIGGLGIIKHGLIPADIYFAIISMGIISSLAFSCISTFCSFVVRGKAVPAVIIIALLAGMLLLSSELGSILGESKYNLKIDTVNGKPYDNVEVIPEDAEITYKETPNPNYCSGTKRKVFEFISNVLPTSHLSVVSNIYLSSDKDGVWFSPHYSDHVKIETAKQVYEYTNVLYCLGFSVFITALGVLIFRKEQLS